MYRAELGDATQDQIRAASRVCPFSDEAPSEDSLGAASSEAPAQHHALLGQYSAIFAGRVSDPGYTLASSSGGLASWFAQRLIDSGRVAGVISVGHADDGPGIYAYQITADPASPTSRKSAYYASTMSEVLSRVENLDGQFALVGLPCFIKAARALCVERPALAQKLTVFVGLVCGHYKTQAFAESLAWQIGVPPQELEDIDFRVKRPDRPASDYDFGAKRAGETDWHFGQVRSLVGGSWGHGLFQPECCNFCDDVVAETASISFGDAWLPRFTANSNGTNVVICRDPSLQSYFDDAAATGEIGIESLSADDAALTQAGGFRHRREGLAVRLADDLAAGLSVPQKRVSPDASAVSKRRVRLIRQRRRLSADSHAAFAAARATGDLSGYLRTTMAGITRYQRLDTSLGRRIIRRLQYTVRLVADRFSS
ncbi:Coenzyme F420 hydrogenase/dehydrogenase, beta subunit C-terminal domain [Propionicimonas paludicola]|nr:Coenzyme F420 hydrogenase/dehydrogenase, beta subunit C-terminal domain [Propionicimonas paludicola]